MQARYEDCLGHGKSRVYESGGVERKKPLKKKAKELLHLVIGILTAWRAAAGLEKDRYWDERNWSWEAMKWFP